MKTVAVILSILLLLLQFEFWFARGGLISLWHLRLQISQQQKNNETLKRRNTELVSEIHNLKYNHDFIESHARYDLGMTKKGETFYRIVKH